jgi:hypothetical protein
MDQAKLAVNQESFSVSTGFFTTAKLAARQRY